MDPFDTAATRAIWQRVLQPREEEMSLEDTLSEMIADEYADHAIYLSMAGCAGRFAPKMRAIAADELRHARRLTALHFLLTGTKPCPRHSAHCGGSFCQMLRVRYTEELSGAGKYREAAERWSEHAALFYELADAEQRHSCILQRIAEQVICA